MHFVINRRQEQFEWHVTIRAWNVNQNNSIEIMYVTNSK